MDEFVGENAEEVEAEQSGKRDIGRIGENIVTNEFLWRGFLVTHLDKGTRGVSANADLMVGHSKLQKPLLIQVKSCFAKKAPNWIFVGNLTKEVIEDNEQMYNKKNATTGRTYGRKRSDQSTAHSLAGRRPSTYGAGQ